MPKSKSSIIHIALISLTLILLLAAVSGYVYNSLCFQEPFHIGFAQYPGATIWWYMQFSPNMQMPQPENYSGLKFIDWYYLDENGNECVFDPKTFVPPEYVIGPNYINVYGRWETVDPATQQ